jgi:nitrile hydratase
MSRLNDVGGLHGFGAIEREADEPRFHHEWEARVFALNSVLLRKGVYTLDEFRDAIEQMPPDAYRDASYYERWLAAIETLLARKGVLDAV